MEGRAPGSAGLQRAETYVIDQLQKTGLAPAGVHRSLQPVKLLRRRVVERDSSVALLRNGAVDPLVPGEDVFFPNDVDVAGKVEAPLVFLGYGLQIPAKNIDDFAGLDLKGKIAVTVPGAESRPDAGDGQRNRNSGGATTCRGRCARMCARSGVPGRCGVATSEIPATARTWRVRRRI